MAKTIVGRLIGRHGVNSRRPIGEIVQITQRGRSLHPAENSFVYVDVSNSGSSRARYISWINLYDIEFANRVEPNQWRTVEPSRPYYRTGVTWQPFGWEDKELPSVADRR